ncbi:MAG: insulinase family protein, partial [Planctomycetota bacterium]|nr:insulinase family protein [Planctomycetota bacterium]
LAAEPVREKELEKARNRLETAVLRRLESNYDIAIALAIYELNASNGWEYLRDMIDGYYRVTPEDIMAVAAKYFVPARKTVATIEPR